MLQSSRGVAVRFSGTRTADTSSPTHTDRDPSGGHTSFGTLMERRYYESYARLERTHWWFAGRREILLRLLAGLRLPPDLEILNVGSCTGASSNWLEPFGRVHSLELDLEAATWSRKDGLRRVVAGSILDLPARDGAFDLVAALDVVEHVEDDARAVGELIRVARPGGLLLLTVPALPWLWSQHDVVNRHHRRYTAGSFLRLFRGRGLRVLRWSYFNFLLLPAVAGFRLGDRLVGLSRLRGPSGTDLEVSDSRWARALGRGALALESRLLDRVRLPLGASLLALAQAPRS